MSRLSLTACCLALAACGPRSEYHDYSTPERAARSFIEAGRVGDTYSARQAIARGERDGDLHIDYGGIGDYSLTLERLIHGEEAVVILTTGNVRSPIACVAEGKEWKVTIEGTMEWLQSGRLDVTNLDAAASASAPPSPR